MTSANHSGIPPGRTAAGHCSATQLHTHWNQTIDLCRKNACLSLRAHAWICVHMNMYIHVGAEGPVDMCVHAQTHGTTIKGITASWHTQSSCGVTRGIFGQHGTTSARDPGSEEMHTCAMQSIQRPLHTNTTCTQRGPCVEATQLQEWGREFELSCHRLGRAVLRLAVLQLFEHIVPR